MLETNLPRTNVPLTIISIIFKLQRTESYFYNTRLAALFTLHGIWGIVTFENASDNLQIIDFVLPSVVSLFS